MKTLDFTKKNALSLRLLVLLTVIIVSTSFVFAQKKVNQSTLFVANGMSITKIDDVSKNVKGGKSIILQPGKHNITYSIPITYHNDFNNQNYQILVEKAIEFEFEANKSYRIEYSGPTTTNGSELSKLPPPVITLL